jgi:hypothetical protein
VGLRRPLAGVLLALASGACLDPNPDFEGDETSTGPTSASMSGDPSSGDTSSADASSADASSSGAGVCEPDGYETDGEMEGMIGVGVFSLILEEAGATDHFNMFVEGVGMGELHFAVDADLRICAYPSCEIEAAMPPSCIAPATSSTLPDEGTFGCCGDGVLDLGYECPAAQGAKIHVRVFGATADCTHYDLEAATTLP